MKRLLFLIGTLMAVGVTIAKRHPRKTLQLTTSHKENRSLFLDPLMMAMNPLMNPMAMHFPLNSDKKYKIKHNLHVIHGPHGLNPFMYNPMMMGMMNPYMMGMMNPYMMGMMGMGMYGAYGHGMMNPYMMGGMAMMHPYHPMNMMGMMHPYHPMNMMGMGMMGLGMGMMGMYNPYMMGMYHPMAMAHPAHPMNPYNPYGMYGGMYGAMTGMPFMHPHGDEHADEEPGERKLTESDDPSLEKLLKDMEEEKRDALKGGKKLMF